MFHDLAGRWRLPRLPPGLLRCLLGLPRRPPTRAERLAMVPAHLREGQMEFLKLLAHGRLAEFLGPLAFDHDHVIRIVDFAFAADAIERRMPSETRTWTQAYVDGLNHHWARLPRRAPEFRLLGRGPEPWTIRDVCTVGRLVGAD